MPLTRLIVGTSLGSTAAVVPLTIGAVPFFARIVEAALAEVEKGRIEAVLAMGGALRHVIEKVWLVSADAVARRSRPMPERPTGSTRSAAPKASRIARPSTRSSVPLAAIEDGLYQLRQT